MKMSRLASLAILGLALALTPVYAQRGGGGRSGGGGGSHTSSSSMSRGGGSHSSGSSFSRSSSPSSSRSSSPSSSRSSYSNSSRSSSPSSSRSSYNSSSRSSSPSVSRSSTPSVSRSSSSSGSRSSYSRSDGGSRAAGVGRPANAPSRSEGAPGRVRSGEHKDGPGITGRPGGTPPTPDGGYARPGHPGPMPPSHRPMHPAPYFWHPHHHCIVHCHPLYWDPFIPRPYYWPGFWHYGWTYWYDYHVTDIVVVRDYMRDTYKVDLITYAFSGDYMYALVNDPDGYTYIQVYDKDDHLLAEQRVNRRYCKMEIDPENGGCWIMKKRDKDPLLFLYTEDGKLLIYEAD